MRIYRIECPYTSQGLTLMYNKKVEAYSGEAVANPNGEYYDVKFDTLHVWSKKQKKWVEKDSKPGKVMVTELCLHTLPQKFSCFYTTLNAAIVAKLQHIVRVKAEMELEFKRRQEAAFKNTEDVEGMLEKYQINFPELFI